MTRREWLRVGGLSTVGLMLPELLAADARASLLVVLESVALLAYMPVLTGALPTQFSGYGPARDHSPVIVSLCPVT